MRELSSAISEAARATTLAEIAEHAFPALARALDACPAFLAEVSPDFVGSEALAGEYRDVLGGYLREFTGEDPLIGTALSVPRAVLLLEQHVDRRTIRASRAYHEFHRGHDMEHHMLVRFFGDTITSPGALAMGLTRGRRQPEFGARERRIAELVTPALRGAVLRIRERQERPRLERAVELASTDHGLSRAEARVLEVLLLGSSNAAIARQLCLSIDTVKTHVQRILRKLGVESRAQAIATLRDQWRAET